MHKIITVFSNIKGIEDVAACHKQHENSIYKSLSDTYYKHFSTFSEANFNRMELNDDRNIILFYRSLPSWLPAATKASIALIPVEDFPSHPWSESTVDLRSMIHMANRADVVVANSRDEAFHIAGFMSIDKVVYANPIYYNKNFFKTTSYKKGFSSKNFMDARILVIGNSLDRKVIKTFKTINKCFSKVSLFGSLQKGQFDEMCKSDIVIAVSKNVEASIPYTLLTRAAASTSCVMTDYRSLGMEECLHFFSDLELIDEVPGRLNKSIGNVLTNGMNVTYGNQLSNKVKQYELMDNLANTIIERLQILRSP